MINRHILEHHIDLKLDTNLVEIISDDKGHVKAILTDKGETIECQIVGFNVSSNIDFLKESGIELGKGILVNRFFRNIKDIYAIGDCGTKQAIDERRPIEAVWYTGRMMEKRAQTLTGTPTEYKPGHWFNSAKFLDIEYQTYGWVWAEAKETKSILLGTHFRKKSNCI
jgi:NADPH-dependent 2,4-dienoyl-CoA reductase/sulfur reductase-like enzyme